MATERFPLHSWKLGANARLKWPNRFTPDTFRVSGTRRTVARTEFFGAAGGGQQIIEADGASAGTATAAAVSAAIWNVSGASTGLATTSAQAAAIALSAGASAGVATADAVSATIAAMQGVSENIAVSQAVAAAVWVFVGDSIASASASAQGEDAAVKEEDAAPAPVDVGPSGMAGGGGGGGGPLDMGEESPPFKPIIYIQEPQDRFRAQRERSTQLREQIRIALEGPSAPEVRRILEPEPVDAIEPLHERINVEALSDEIVSTVTQHYERARREIEAKRRREIERDDEDVLMLAA